MIRFTIRAVDDRIGRDIAAVERAGPPALGILIKAEHGSAATRWDGSALPCSARAISSSERPPLFPWQL